jgi:hypothetical protein
VYKTSLSLCSLKPGSGCCTQEVVPSKPKQNQASRDAGTSTEACRRSNAAIQVHERRDAATQAAASQQDAQLLSEAKLPNKLGISLAKAEALIIKELEANLHAYKRVSNAAPAAHLQVRKRRDACSDSASQSGSTMDTGCMYMALYMAFFTGW